MTPPSTTTPSNEPAGNQVIGAPDNPAALEQLGDSTKALADLREQVEAIKQLVGTLQETVTAIALAVEQILQEVQNPPPATYG